MSGVGQMMGYGAGAIDMVQIFGTAFGDNQLKQLTIISALFMLGSTALTCWAVTERALVSEPSGNQRRFKVVRQIYGRLYNLPPRIRLICWAQFWAWIGWYPFTFYSTIWVSEVYFLYDVPPDETQSKDMTGAAGRVGSRSLAIYSVVTFAAVWILPLIVESPEARPHAQQQSRPVSTFRESFTCKRPNLLDTWVLGHLLFAGVMLMAPLATSYSFATFLVCICGM